MTMNPNLIQAQASNPYISAWVSASAGSGKTKVLTDRVLNLMLLSGQPEKVLCLTFTKVAAAEMQERLTQILKRWATLDEPTLSKEIEKLTQETPEAETLTKARTLFSKILEVPGGLKMMTIHSFCTSILHRFPLEADVPPNFQVLDELITNTLMDKALNQVLENTSSQKDIQFLAKLMNKEELISLLKGVLKDSESLLQLSNRFGGASGIIQELKKYFQIPNITDIFQLISPSFDINEWPILVEKYIKKTDGQIKKNHLEDPTAQEVFLIWDKIKAFHIVQKSEILFHLIFHILEVYQQLKFKQNALDYDDLINKTLTLLKTKNQASWVLFKLDGGIDHILVDEAQDTNPKQWEIIEALTNDFFAGETKSDTLRTLFVVGDKKQSIYSFQGARPDEFDYRHQFFQDKIRNSQNTFETIPFNFSFRSTKPVLDLVNACLKNPKAKAGVLHLNEEALHISQREKEAGKVEIWPLINPPEAEEGTAWKATQKRIQSQSAMSILSQKIAKKIAKMIHDKEVLASRGRPVEPGDFLILLQKRGQFMAELVRALKEENVPVAGVDKLTLTDHIAICDLLALVRFVLLPEDDLNLANLIKSPLLGLTEDDLYKICVNRKNQSVWQRLKTLYPKQADILKNVMDLADRVPPFEFFEYILDTLGGRKKFIARLGNEVQDALDSFLDLVLQFETNQSANLQEFLHWITTQEIIVKRDLNSANDNAVRIMTVHGSKGLQGNIVFLPDTRGTKTIERKKESLLWTENQLPLWISDKKEIPLVLNPLFEKLDQQAREENHRLLYVALTRAADQLYICGYNGKRKAQDGNWYDLILHSLDKESIDKPISFESKQSTSLQTKVQNTLSNDANELPDWALKIPQLKETQTILSPSKILPLEEEKNLTPTQSQQKAMERGSFIHMLLQYLPTIPKEQRPEKLAKLCPKEIIVSDTILDLIDNSPIAELFGPASLAEVPVIGTYQGQPVSGQIDRLVVLDKEVLIIDFKTNQVVPKKIPSAYAIQLNVYKDLIKNIFPDKIVKSYLLWTENLTYTEVK